MIFELVKGSSTITVLASFNGANGRQPQASLIIDSEGDLFGTTSGGGEFGNGAIFELQSGSSTITLLASFDGTDGAIPVGPLLMDSFGDLYGTTTAGGASGDGTIFALFQGDSAVTTLASFNGADGSAPTGGSVMDSQGDLYGTASGGGAENDGTIYELPSGSSTISVLATFDSTNGTTPGGTLLMDSSGNLYGGTTQGGAFDFGTVFELPKGSATISTLASLDGSNGSGAFGLLMDSFGNLYGVTSAGPFGFGTVFELAHGSSTITTLFGFDEAEGEYPGPLFMDGEGNIYGSTEDGGAHNNGTVFEVSPTEPETVISNVVTPMLTTTAGGTIALGSGNKLTDSAILAGGNNPTGTITFTLTAPGGSVVDTVSDAVSGNGTYSTTNGFLPTEPGTYEWSVTYSGDSNNELVSASPTSISTLASFNGGNGEFPMAGLIMDGQGNFYGTTEDGGTSNDGTVFELAAGSSTITTLASFDVTNGSKPVGSLIMDSAGNLYGTTEVGGAFADGTIFELPKGSNTILTLASFDDTTSGSEPLDGLILDSDGNLYGTASIGGTFGDGTIFELLKGSNTITVLAAFNGVNNGANPAASLVMDGQGNLYGTTQSGGSTDDGVLFELPDDSSTITVLATFGGGNPTFPYSALVMDSQGDLYGTTQSGGTFGLGTIYEYGGSSTFTVLASFDATNGEVSRAGLLMNGQGSLYGTTEEGGAFNDGTVFELAHGSSTITTLLSFTGVDGSNPVSTLVLDGSGNLYGTTGTGGGSNEGTIFELSSSEAETVSTASPGLTTTPGGTIVIASGSKLTDSATLTGGDNPTGTITFTLYAPDGTTVVDTEAVPVNGDRTYTTPNGFVPTAIGTYQWSVSYSGDTNNNPGSAASLSPISLTNSNGLFPNAGVILDSAGNVYGTTSGGGANSVGTIFEVAKGSSTITVLASFDGTDGSDPAAALVMDSASNLYGTTTDGGAGGDGTVFELAKGSSTITVLASFNSTVGASPSGALVMDSAGNLFGTTQLLGPNGDGTVWELAKDGSTITVLAPIRGTDGSTEAIGGLVMDSAGNLYGAAVDGGADEDGSIFELAKGSGTITVLASLTGSNGIGPFASLIIDSAGNLYGTAVDGGAQVDGTIFELAQGSSTITALASFDGTDGRTPNGGLLMDSAGNLYGTASLGGASGDGVVYELPQGSSTITVLATFDGSNGADPIQTSLAMDGAGNLYGTTQRGGASFDGTFFELSTRELETVIPATATPTLTTTAGRSVVLGNSGTLTDSATLAGGNNPTGTITFVLSAPNGTVVDTMFDTVSGNGTYNTPSGFEPTVAGTYEWSVSYSGDSNNGPVSDSPTSVSTLVNFDGANGNVPIGNIVMDAAGNLYGTTLGGNSVDGTIYELAKGSSTITTLYSFTGQNGGGVGPWGGVSMDSTGNLYGTTFEGGASGDGTIFELPHGSNTVTILASFNGTNGANPFDSLIMDSQGNLYGTADFGGASNEGTIFELPSGSSTITALASFDGSNGQNPEDSLVMDDQGNLYGTTGSGGANNLGVIVELAKGSSTITALVTFSGPNQGVPYSSLIIDGEGNLYGTTQLAGTSGDGTVFELPSGSSTIAVLASFNGTNGEDPRASLMMDAEGNLYGTTSTASFVPGTVFELARGSSTITTLVDIAIGGSNPGSALIMDAAGNLYGATETGGLGGDGAIFELTRSEPETVSAASPTLTTTPGGTVSLGSGSRLNASATLSGGVNPTGTITFTLYAPNGTTVLDTETDTVSSNGTYSTPNGYLPTAGGTYQWSVQYSGDTNNNAAAAAASLSSLANFNISVNGAEPNGVIMDSAGNLYGTTNIGGFDDEGMIFELPKGSSTIAVLASFNVFASGYAPVAGLVMDSSGNLYGTTTSGGASGDGTVFELPKGGSTITLLASFDLTDGSDPTDALIIDGSGNLYGTTTKGGAFNDGTIFELPQGSQTITTLASFDSTNGSDPSGGLIMDGAGNLYGTTQGGGSGSAGTVYELAKGSSTITVLASFNYTDGSAPSDTLLMDSSGDLYGDTTAGGAFNDGTLFELPKGSGTIVTLASFDSADGAQPTSALLMDGAGNLYGTTAVGGNGSDGTVFELARGSSTITTLLSFNVTEGRDPEGALIMDSAGNLYGNTLSGGTTPFFDGNIFELSTREPETVSLANPTLSTTPGSTFVIGNGSKLTDSATLSGGENPTGTITFTLYAPGGTTVINTETVPVSGNNTYTTPNGYTPSATGTYQWVVTYSGDSNNNPFSSTLGSNELVESGLLQRHHQWIVSGRRPDHG